MGPGPGSHGVIQGCLEVVTLRAEEKGERMVGARVGQIQNAGSVKRKGHSQGVMCRPRASDSTFWSPMEANGCKISIFRKFTLSMWRLDQRELQAVCWDVVTTDDLALSQGSTLGWRGTAAFKR